MDYEINTKENKEQLIRAISALKENLKELSLTNYSANQIAKTDYRKIENEITELVRQKGFCQHLLDAVDKVSFSKTLNPSPSTSEKLLYENLITFYQDARSFKTELQKLYHLSELCHIEREKCVKYIDQTIENIQCEKHQKIIDSLKKLLHLDEKLDDLEIETAKINNSQKLTDLKNIKSAHELFISLPQIAGEIFTGFPYPGALCIVSASLGYSLQDKIIPTKLKQTLRIPISYIMEDKNLLQAFNLIVYAESGNSLHLEEKYIQNAITLLEPYAWSGIEYINRYFNNNLENCILSLTE